MRAGPPTSTDPQPGRAKSLYMPDSIAKRQTVIALGRPNGDMRDRIVRGLHGRAPLLQRMTSLHQRLAGPSEVAWQSLATDSVVRGSSGPTSVIPGLLSLTVTGIASNPTCFRRPPMSLFMAHEILGTAAARVGRQRSQSAHSTVEDPALRC
jgi:hypothetical protein